MWPPTVMNMVSFACLNVLMNAAAAVRWMMLFV